MSKIVADNISPRGSDVTIAGVGTFSSSGVNLTGVVTATSFVGDVTGNATGLSGSPTLTGITSVSTTNLTVNGNAYPNGGPLSNRNLIINGAMQVAQRGTSSTSSDFRTVDRFFYNFGNTLAGTQSQQTLSSGTPYNEGFRNFYRFAISTPGSATSTYCQLIQGIEAQNLATSGWQYTSADSDITVSFWVRSSVAQTFYGALKSSDGTAQNYVFSFALSADTWTKVTKTIPGNTNVQIDNDNGQGAQLIIYPFMGTNYSDSSVNVDAWQAYSGSTRIPDMATDWVLTNGATFDVTGVQLEVGSVATPFEHRSYGDEFQRCCRYYQRLEGRSGQDGDICISAFYTTTNAYGPIYFPNGNMRTYPTVNIIDNAITFYYPGNADASLGFFVGGIHLERIALNVQNVSGSAGDSGFLRLLTSADVFEFSAEL